MLNFKPFVRFLGFVSGSIPCGSGCLTLAVGGTIVVIIALVITSLLVYKNCRYHVTKESKEKPIGGSVASMSAAAPSDYVDSTEQRMSSGVSQVSLERPPWLISPQLQVGFFLLIGCFMP